MKADWSHLDKYRQTSGAFGTKPGDRFGVFRIPHGKTQFIVIAGSAMDGVDWEHVSARALDYKGERTPTWGEMCLIKELFWEPEEAVIQIHPPASQYVNTHPHVLHLWRPTEEKIPMPPKDCV